MVKNEEIATRKAPFWVSRDQRVERGILEPVHGSKGTNLLFSNGLTVSSHGYSREPDGLLARIQSSQDREG